MPSRAATARKAVLVAAVAVLVLDPRSLVWQGEAMQHGVTRTVTLAVARPLEAVSRALWLEQATDAALATLHIGEGGRGGTPPLLASGAQRSSQAVPRIPGAPDESGRARAGGAIAPAPARIAGPSSPRPSAARPLNLLVTGDSMVGYLGPRLAAALAGTDLVRPQVDVHNGTGLTRPLLVDWAALAQRQVARYRPDVAVVMLGTNDDIGMRLPDGTVAAEGSSLWVAEYRRRLEIVMGILSQRGRAQVMWLTLPMAGEQRRNRVYTVINDAARQTARVVPGMRVIEVGETLTPGGRYRDTMPVKGRDRIVRAPDGIHLNQTGSEIAAEIVLATLRRDHGVP